MEEKAMNAQDQIKERAKDAAWGFCRAFQVAGLGAELTKEFELALTAQQTAAESAHREEVERLTKELAEFTELAKHRDELIRMVEDISSLPENPSVEQRLIIFEEAVERRLTAERDTARAESAKLREVLAKVTEALTGCKKAFRELSRFGYIKNEHAVSDAVDDSLALAATVLKEGK